MSFFPHLLTVRFVCAGGDKEEKAGEGRTGRKRKNVKGNGGDAISAAMICASKIPWNNQTSLHFRSQVPDPSQVTAMATQSSVAVWLTIYFQPSNSIKSLLRSPIGTRDSTGWDACRQPRPPPLMGTAAFDADNQNGSDGGSVEPPLTCTRHNGRAWEPVQFGKKLIIDFLVCQLLLYLVLFQYLKEISPSFFFLNCIY